MGVFTFGARRKMLLAIAGEGATPPPWEASIFLKKKSFNLGFRPEQEQKEAVGHTGGGEARLPGGRSQRAAAADHGRGRRPEQPLVDAAASQSSN